MVFSGHYFGTTYSGTIRTFLRTFFKDALTRDHGTVSHRSLIFFIWCIRIMIITESVQRVQNSQLSLAETEREKLFPCPTVRKDYHLLAME